MESDASDTAVRCVGLAKRYRSGAADLTVFSDLHLEVRRGERLALIGESGSGKSTLLHLIGALDSPSNGKIYFGHTDIGSLSAAGLADLRNRKIGFVWQNHSLLPEFTAHENVMMPLLIRGMGMAEASSKALIRLEEVGLAARVTHRAGELSGGEQQRVALARALAGNPNLLLADEPTGNLDGKTGEMIISLLATLHQAHALTSIYVTHNLSFASRCDRVLELVNGNLVPWTGLEPIHTEDRSGIQ